MNIVSGDAFLPNAARILQRTWGADVQVTNPVVLKDGGRCRVVRCTVANAPNRISTVIVKQIKAQPARGFDEWASLAFLSGLPNAETIVPRFYGGDQSRRLFVMEDFGTGNTLHDLLNGRERGAARAALYDLARQMARLHAATQGQNDAFDTLRATLPDGEGAQRFNEAGRWRVGEDKILRWFEALNVVPPPDLTASWDDIAGVYREPGAWLAFSHGDPAPTNNHFANGQARLLDFEYGAFRHALYDITAWQILCPLPLEIVAEMRRVFQNELAQSMPVARDEARFAEAWAMLCAFRVLALLTWIAPESVRNSDYPWVDDWTARSAVLAAVSRLGRVAAPIARLAAIADAANRLLGTLRMKWPEFSDKADATPHWPALET